MCLLALLLSAPVKELVNHWAGRGSLVQALLLIYGIPVSILYLLTAFLFDVPAEEIRKEHLVTFLGRRKMLIMMFLFVIIALILLIMASVAT
jgi:phosphotransferase system  glucose/maltose/N-acetylglucosamine-specific IIC component